MARREQLWNPTAPDQASNPFDEIEPRASDYHLVVDEIDSNRVRLVISSWPSVDADDRLVFPGPEAGSEALLDDPSDSELILDASALHSRVSEERADRQQLAPDRPLRVGDVFWFRAAADWAPADNVELNGELVDVTFAARGEAKAAMAWAVTGSSMARADLMTAGAELELEPEIEEEVREEVLESRDVGQSAEPEDARAEAEPESRVEPARPSVPGAVASPSV
ncbi:MAG TPA: hypothetical protein VF083_11815 [Acidimicrobiia bacterium]